jgi:hypothetical protein
MQRHSQLDHLRREFMISYCGRLMEGTVLALEFVYAYPWEVIPIYVYIGRY